MSTGKLKVTTTCLLASGHDVVSGRGDGDDLQGLGAEA